MQEDVPIASLPQPVAKRAVTASDMLKPTPRSQPRIQNPVRPVRANTDEGPRLGRTNAHAKPSKQGKRRHAEPKPTSIALGLNVRQNGQGPTAWFILDYMMLSFFGGIDDAMHTLILGVLGYVKLQQRCIIKLIMLRD